MRWKWNRNALGFRECERRSGVVMKIYGERKREEE
ncbi:unnamed protein product [Rhodiola kirilowii]